MKFKEFFKNLVINIKDGTSRFFVAFICSVLGFLTASYEIIFETGKDDIIVPLCMAYGLVAMFSVLLKTIQEYLLGKLNGIVQYILCAAAAIISFVLINQNFDSLYTIMAYSGIMISMVCFIFFVLMRGENKHTAFPKIVTSLVFATAVCGVLSGGLSICIAAFQFLIFSWDNIYKVYFVINLFVWVTGFTNIFLALIPKNNIPVAGSKIFRTFILFVVLPLYILLITILLVYLGKIVITRNMPVGEINPFASFASLFFIFILLSVMQYTEKLAKVYVKFGGYFLIPVLIMQAIAVFERINAYGLTTPRTISLALIIISVLFILGAIVIPKHLNKIALVAGIMVLVVTTTPFNVIDLPISSQTNILKTTLEANGMIKDGTVILNENLSKADAAKIISAYEYLKFDANHVPEFMESTDNNFEEFINSYKTQTDYVYCNFRTKNSVDISSYTKMTRAYISSNHLIKTENKNVPYEIDVTPIAEELHTKYGTSKTDVDIYIIDENTALYFNNFSFELENDKFLRYYFDGYILSKN